jgi:hypothetical protein
MVKKGGVRSALLRRRIEMARSSQIGDGHKPHGRQGARPGRNSFLLNADEVIE